MGIMSDGTPEEVLTKIFRVFDVNSDGTITQKEMTKLIKDMYGLLKSEDPNLAAKDLVSKSAFAEMDKDQDGKVTTAEFIAACTGQEEFSKMLALILIYGLHPESEGCIMKFEGCILNYRLHPINSGFHPEQEGCINKMRFAS